MGTATATRPSKPATPEVEQPPAPDTVDLDMLASDLAKIVAAITAAASTDEARPILTGVNVEVAPDGTITFVGTDGYRLHVITLKDRTTARKGTFTALIPAAFLKHWAKAPRSKYQRATVTLTGETATIDNGELTQSAKLVELSRGVPYPSWRQILRQTPAEQTDHSAFNARYLGATLTICDRWGDGRKSVKVRLAETKPCLFECDSDIGNLTVVLMPVRVP